MQPVTSTADLPRRSPRHRVDAHHRLVRVLHDHVLAVLQRQELVHQHFDDAPHVGHVQRDLSCKLVRFVKLGSQNLRWCGSVRTATRIRSSSDPTRDHGLRCPLCELAAVVLQFGRQHSTTLQNRVERRRLGRGMCKPACAKGSSWQAPSRIFTETTTPSTPAGRSSGATDAGRHLGVPLVQRVSRHVLLLSTFGHSTVQLAARNLRGARTHQGRARESTDRGRGLVCWIDIPAE